MGLVALCVVNSFMSMVPFSPEPGGAPETLPEIVQVLVVSPLEQVAPPMGPTTPPENTALIG